MMTSKILLHLRATAVGAAALATVLAGALGPADTVRADDRGQAPSFRVDPTWPKELPNNWLVGQVAGIAVDRHDNIWIVQRPNSLTSDEAGADAMPPISDCCHRSPSVMVFDRNGDLLKAWGGPYDPGFLGAGGKCDPAAGCEWPQNEHGIYVDHNDYVYIGGNGGPDHQVLKFTMDGTFVLQIGKAGVTAGSNDTGGAPNGTPLLGRPADTEVDPMTNELYIADGYLNHRVLVVDAETGMYKRHWGGYGQRPVDDAGSNALPPYAPNQAPDPHFRNPVHAVRITNDGYVYVADRANDRIQVFNKAGMFQTEFFVERDTLGPGSTWDLDVSIDRAQSCIFNADGSNNYVWTLSRASGDILATFGHNGRSAGQFHWVHNLAVDSRGNIYTAEVDTGKRAQKFELRGRRDCRS